MSMRRRACYGVLRFIMESGAKGCEVIVSGKLRAQRAKAMKFKDGYMISSGQPVNDYIDAAVRHVMLRQGVLGIKVRPCLLPRAGMCHRFTAPHFGIFVEDRQFLREASCLFDCCRVHAHERCRDSVARISSMN